jgi:hypothetical protein
MRGKVISDDVDVDVDGEIEVEVEVEGGGIVECERSRPIFYFSLLFFGQKRYRIRVTPTLLRSHMSLVVLNFRYIFKERDYQINEI